MKTYYNLTHEEYFNIVDSIDYYKHLYIAYKDDKDLKEEEIHIENLLRGLLALFSQFEDISNELEYGNLMADIKDAVNDVEPDFDTETEFENHDLHCLKHNAYIAIRDMIDFNNYAIICFVFNNDLIKAFTPIEKMIKRLSNDCYSRKLKEMINETNILKDIA